MEEYLTIQNFVILVIGTILEWKFKVVDKIKEKLK